MKNNFKSQKLQHTFFREQNFYEITTYIEFYRKLNKKSILYDFLSKEKKSSLNIEYQFRELFPFVRRRLSFKRHAPTIFIEAREENHVKPWVQN